MSDEANELEDGDEYDQLMVMYEAAEADLKETREKLALAESTAAGWETILNGEREHRNELAAANAAMRLALEAVDAGGSYISVATRKLVADALGCRVCNGDPAGWLSDHGDRCPGCGTTQHMPGGGG